MTTTESGSPDVASDAGRLAETLRDEIRRGLGDDRAQVSAAHRVSGGASRETWILEVAAAPSGRLVLRCDPPGLEREGGIELETAAIGAAASAGVPVPAIIAADGGGGAFGRPYMITAFVDGEALARRILTSDDLAEARAGLAADCGDALARLHAVTPPVVPGLEVIDPVATQRQRLDDLDDAHPVLELGLTWLDERRPADVSPVLVHGDFRNGNFIVGPDGLRAVLDWEVAHLGDPYEDLGWLCVRQWRFRGPGPVGGFGTFGELAAAYEARSGEALDPHRWRWWLIFGTVRWGVSCNFQASKHLRHQQRSIDLVAIGRRACENELDLLDLIDHAEAHP